MGIIFLVATESKSDVIKILTEILKQAEKEGVEIYEKDECSANESKHRQSRNKITRISNRELL